MKFGINSTCGISKLSQISILQIMLLPVQILKQSKHKLYSTD